MMVLNFMLLWLGLERAQSSGAISRMDIAEKEESECMLATKALQKNSADVLEESQNEAALSSLFLDRKVYIVTAGTPSEYLSVLQPGKQGDPGVWEKCKESTNPGCKWEIKPTADGQYYLKTSSTDETLHWTHGSSDGARGLAATLYPCMPPTPDYSNCKWRFVKLDKGQNEYLIQGPRENNYLIAPAPADGKTMATVDVCSASEPDPKCVWKLGLDLDDGNIPDEFLEGKLYIESMAAPSEYLSVLQPNMQGDPGVFQKCASISGLAGCMWEIKKASDGHYYLKTSESDQTLHWTWGASGKGSLGEAATLFPCMTSEYSDAKNCKWSFIKVHPSKDEYLIKASNYDAYIIAPAPEDGQTLATVNSCSSFSPDPKCVWKMRLAA